MYSILQDLQVVEASSFVAAPSCGLHLASLGATVIRIDPIGGGLDFRRWPKVEGGSLYWEGLQKNKRSVAIDLGTPRGRELAVALITAPGENSGLFVTNFPRAGFLSHENLARHREDLITLRVQGWADGRSGLDYTINAITGYPFSTGPVQADGPVNHVMPGWDLLTGALGSTHLLAAERHRRLTGQGQEIALPLSSVAISSLGALGQIAEVDVLGQERARLGNNVYGAFGNSFKSSDDRHVMFVAMSPKQWDSVVMSLDIGAAIDTIERERNIDLRTDEGTRFEHIDAINPVVAAAVSRLPYAQLEQLLEKHAVCWGPYQSLRETMATHEELQASHPMMSVISHPSGTTYRTPGNPAQYSGMDRLPPSAAPLLGADTESVLADVLKLTSSAIGELMDQGIVADADKAQLPPRSRTAKN